MALGMTVVVSQLVEHFGLHRNTLETVGWIEIKKMVQRFKVHRGWILMTLVILLLSPTFGQNSKIFCSNISVLISINYDVGEPLTSVLLEIIVSHASMLALLLWAC